MHDASTHFTHSRNGSSLSFFPASQSRRSSHVATSAAPPQPSLLERILSPESTTGDTADLEQPPALSPFDAVGSVVAIGGGGLAASSRFRSSFAFAGLKAKVAS